MDEEVVIYCPDCRGKCCFGKDDWSDIAEEDVIDCDICGMEMRVIQKDPIKIKLYEGDF